tara:strand:+ start:238 stop:687 length:450 start_codon:yes stop_codon:yes gene_type:complete
MKITKQQLTKIIKEEYRAVLTEAGNFDKKTGEPLTDKGKELCAKNAECAEQWLKGKDKGAEKDSSSPAEMLLKQYGSEDKIPPEYKAIYDKFVARDAESKKSADDHQGKMQKMQSASKAMQFVSSKMSELIKQQKYDSLIKLAQKLGME